MILMTGSKRFLGVITRCCYATEATLIVDIAVVREATISAPYSIRVAPAMREVSCMKAKHTK